MHSLPVNNSITVGQECHSSIAQLIHVHTSTAFPGPVSLKEQYLLLLVPHPSTVLLSQSTVKLAAVCFLHFQLVLLLRSYTVEQTMNIITQCGLCGLCIAC